MYRVFLFLLIITFSHSLCARAADINASEDTILKLAENGDAEAQLTIAENYGTGKDGYPKSDAERIKWLTKAADQGNPKAQYKLALAYFYGNDAVKPDYVKSHMFFELTIDNNSPGSGNIKERAILNRDKLETVLSTDQIAKSDAMLHDWQVAHSASVKN